MSSYFDDADAQLHGIFEAEDEHSKVPGGEQRWSFFWKLYRQWEIKLIEDCLGATRARRFPPELAAKIRHTIERERVFATSKAAELHERNAHSVLSMRHSFLSSRLHSIFHEVATYGAREGIRHLIDNPQWITKRAPKAK